MLCASAVIFVVMFLAAVSFSVNMPTVALSVLVRTIISVLVQTIVTPLLSVLVQTTVLALGHNLAVLVPFGNPIMSLDPAATTSPMDSYSDRWHSGSLHARTHHYTTCRDGFRTDDNAHQQVIMKRTYPFHVSILPLEREGFSVQDFRK
ncbi:hypothetical protein DFP73DRAFT_598627 [Morchella snyderi]|nr:hypothetical protein DFP73DRAFT_598627 [Morchella snyderi]